MNLNKLYDLTEKENIKVYNWNIEDCNGIYLNYDKINAIALNYDELETYVEEKCTLAHELGHHFSNSCYHLNSTKGIIDKVEYQASKWSYVTLIPLPELKEKISNNFNIYELADYFEVTIQFMYNCISFYIGKYGFL